jgi:hypothetical protein
MDDQHPERRHKHKRSSSRRMEEDLNRSSFRQSGESEGRPPPDKVPRTSGADPCSAPKGSEHSSSRRSEPKKSSSQSHSGYEPGGTIPVIVSQGPPQGKSSAAAVASVPASGQPGFGSNVGERGAGPSGYEHGADYGGQLTTRKNSTLVNDAEAASRVEYRYQQVRGHASRTPAYTDPFPRPHSPSARASSVRVPLDSREGESQSTQVIQRMDGFMARLEQLFAASTSAPSKPASTSSPTGEF